MNDGFQGPRLSPSQLEYEAPKYRNLTWRRCCLSPRGGVMQMWEALRLVPGSGFTGFYANVEQNGWSELVIRESSKENESLDTVTRTRLLPAFWMTSCLFIPLDSSLPLCTRPSPLFLFPSLSPFFMIWLLSPLLSLSHPPSPLPLSSCLYLLPVSTFIISTVHYCCCDYYLY